MSVTNDPNYHEGQPVFGPTDAVRPTGETGATCPWCGSERRVGNAPAAGYFIAPCENLECPEMQVYETEEAALAAASRPLPDFPAGAPGPWSGGIYGNGSLAIVDSRGQIVLDLSASESIESSDEREVRDFILSRVNAPARPAADESLIYVPGHYTCDRCHFVQVRSVIDADTGNIYAKGPEVLVCPNDGEPMRRMTWKETAEAQREYQDSPLAMNPQPVAAGLTLTDADRYECEEIARGRWCYSGTAEEARVGKYTVSMAAAIEGLSAALDRAQSLLSSRATGAEVEMPEPSEEAICAFVPPEAGYGDTRHWFNHRWFRAGIAYARRHATIRGKENI